MKSNTLFSSVRKHGFSLVSIPPSTALQLDHSLLQFSRDDTFRFPLPEGQPFSEWPDTYRESYRNMINIAKECFKALLIELKDGSTLSMSNSDKDRAQNILHLHKHLDYSQSSFMNLFNYKYGHLAPHRDRCLVTVVYTHSRSSTQLLQSHQPENTDTDESTDMNASHETSDNNYNYKHSKKNLWCLAPEHEDHPSNIHHWTSIDTLVAIPANQHSVCLHVGEELRALYHNQIPAALHCVQTNPTLPHEEQQRRPAEGGRIVAPDNDHHDRLSAALILSAADISAIVEDMLEEERTT